MAKVNMERIEGESGRHLWKLEMQWDSDVKLSVFGDTVSVALRNLAGRVKEEEERGWRMAREGEREY